MIHVFKTCLFSEERFQMCFKFISRTPAFQNLSLSALNTQPVKDTSSVSDVNRVSWQGGWKRRYCCISLRSRALGAKFGMFQPLQLNMSLESPNIMTCFIWLGDWITNLSPQYKVKNSFSSKFIAMAGYKKVPQHEAANTQLSINQIKTVFHLYYLIINHNLGAHLTSSSSFLPSSPLNTTYKSPFLHLYPLEILLSTGSPVSIKVLPHRGRRLSEVLSLSVRISILL